MAVVIVKMSKQYGKNSPGDVCGFEEETVQHIEKHGGCVRLTKAELEKLKAPADK